MVARVRIRDIGILTAGFPVEFSGLNDYASQCRAVAADELGSRVNDDVGAVLDRPDQVRSAESVVDNHRKPIFVGDLRDRVDVRDIAVGIAQRLNVDCSRIYLDGRFYL